MSKHEFTATILSILEEEFGVDAQEVYNKSPLLGYLNKKTRSANKGSKARGSFANLYAIYVLVEDYINKGYNTGGDYSTYEGAVYATIFNRQRELPFGAGLQNHALNNRLNSEFKNCFPLLEFEPISRIAESERYWFNQNLLRTSIADKLYDISVAVIKIIDAYVETKKESFNRFLEACSNLQSLTPDELPKAEEFIRSQLEPNVDARLFEIVSFGILKYFFHDKKIFWSYEKILETLKEENLVLYKTGRTNANDGGIDFVMKPLGRFFQVTETLDFRKYFLDIEKLQRYPITFVIKSTESEHTLKDKIESNAISQYPIKAIVDKYMACIEEIINIPKLHEMFSYAVANNHLNDILNEIVNQSKVEFNYMEKAQLDGEILQDE